MYVTLMNVKIKTKYGFAFSNLFLKIELNCDEEKYVNFKYICSFLSKMLSNLTCVLIYSLTKCALEYRFKDLC